MAASVKPLPPALVKTQVRGQHLITPLELEVTSLFIRNDDDYASADALLAGIRRARKQWAGEIDEPLRKAREMKQSIDALNRRIDGPLETLYETVRQRMTDYKREEARQLEEAQEKQRKQEAIETKRLEELAAREAAAKTKPMQAKLQTMRERQEAKVEALQDERPQAVKAEGSTARKVKKWRTILSVKEMAELVASGHLPEGLLTIDTAFIHKAGFQVIESWPGFEVYEDITIAGRG